MMTLQRSLQRDVAFLSLIFIKNVLLNRSLLEDLSHSSSAKKIPPQAAKLSPLQIIS